MGAWGDMEPLLLKLFSGKHRFPQQGPAKKGEGRRLGERCFRGTTGEGPFLWGVPVTTPSSRPEKG